MQDPREPLQIAKDHALADEYAPKGSVKHFLLRQGFMPHNEADAEAILIRIIREHENYESERNDTPGRGFRSLPS